MSGNKWIGYIRKLKPYNIVKGMRYLRHFGVKEFLVKLSERMEPEEVPYGPWYEKYRAKEPERERQRKRNWTERRLFSIVVPAYRTPEEFLRQMIDSVLAQTYPYWELCIANGSPEDEGMETVLKEYAGRDNRIRWKALE